MFTEQMILNFEFGVTDYLLSGGDSSDGCSQATATSAAGPQGFRKHFTSRKLDCDNQPPDPERLFQRCFTATVTGVKVESPS